MILINSIVIVSIFALWMPGAPGSVALLWVFAIVYGAFAGAIMSMIPTVLSAICGAENFASKMGLLYVGPFAIGQKQWVMI